MTIFRKSNGKLVPVKELSIDLERQVQKITEDNLENIFNLEFVESEFTLGRFRIDTLAFDKESNSFVIIEYKKVRDTGLIEQGLAYLEILLDRVSDFITEYNEQLNKNLKKSDVDKSQSRVIFVSPSFDKFQKQASNLDLHIDLWEVRVYENDLVEFTPILSKDKTLTKMPSAAGGKIGRISREIKTYTEEYHMEKRASEKTKYLYQEIKEKTLSLGNDIQVVHRKHYIAFKTNRNFVYLNIKRGMIHADLSMAPEKVDDPKGVVRNMDGIGHRSAGNSRITIKDKSDIPYLMVLLEQSYRKSLE